jgi:hypothetical protein
MDFHNFIDIQNPSLVIEQSQKTFRETFKYDQLLSVIF